MVVVGILGISGQERDVVLLELIKCLEDAGHFLKSCPFCISIIGLQDFLTSTDFLFKIYFKYVARTP